LNDLSASASNRQADTEKGVREANMVSVLRFGRKPGSMGDDYDALIRTEEGSQVAAVLVLREAYQRFSVRMRCRCALNDRGAV